MLSCSTKNCQNENTDYIKKTPKSAAKKQCGLVVRALLIQEGCPQTLQDLGLEMGTVFFCPACCNQSRLAFQAHHGQKVVQIGWANHHLDVLSNEDHTTTAEQQLNCCWPASGQLKNYVYFCCSAAILANLNCHAKSCNIQRQTTQNLDKNQRNAAIPHRLLGT